VQQRVPVNTSNSTYARPQELIVTRYKTQKVPRLVEVNLPDLGYQNLLRLVEVEVDMGVSCQSVKTFVI
jgi:hypothetical protein